MRIVTRTELLQLLGVTAAELVTGDTAKAATAGVPWVAEIVYHETSRGAKVFAAGVMNFGGSALWPRVRTMLDTCGRT